MATALEQVRDYTLGDYKYGFITTVDEDAGAARARRGNHQPDLLEEGGAGLAQVVAVGGTAALAEDGRAGLAESRLPADRLPGLDLLFRAAA